MEYDSDRKRPKILVFSTEKISDPAIDLAGLLKQHYPPSVDVISVPCSSGVKPRWIMRAFDKGYGGVFIAADGSDCPFGDTCEAKTARIVSRTHELMEEKGIDKARLRMAAICSVCSEAFVNQVKIFAEYLAGGGGE
ncbi:MAG TPA: hydrogenase iron-sulfur subunit [Candidatus Eisenbacteria bacterium]|uniref:Hydrogenase iron-sulfur subunit n=1 Tax=Eiseniibacteriota bacterium TaxID=2212470 RepID=A0A7V2F4D3_UNCEI|nr:hydrogenase iron-sulfur subunit [Candidatus Eisenbacteria bacterium]